MTTNTIDGHDMARAMSPHRRMARRRRHASRRRPAGHQSAGWRL